MTEGERWARDALVDLRAAGFSARAIRDFLVASHVRAHTTRAARPALARQARAWLLLGAAAWAAPLPPIRRRARPGLAWWGLAALMVDWHLGMLETEAGEPRPLSAADACTLARVWLAPLAAERAAPLVCAIGFGSDGLDGVLARRGHTTRAGRDLEGLADVAFSAAALRGAVRCGGLGRRPALLEAARGSAAVALSLASYFGAARRPSPSLVRAARATAPVRMAGILAAGLGRRRVADALVTAGALAGVASHSREACRGRSVTS